jgi:hypothetical protein
MLQTNLIVSSQKKYVKLQSWLSPHLTVLIIQVLKYIWQENGYGSLTKHPCCILGSKFL